MDMGGVQNSLDPYTPLGGNRFYLVVPLNLIGEVEGSYGLQSPGVERPAPNGCFPQAILQCQAP